MTEGARRDDRGGGLGGDWGQVACREGGLVDEVPRGWADGD